MKDKWDNYIDSLSAFGEDITELLIALKPGPKTDKIKKQVNLRWEKLRKLTDAIGELIVPIDPEDIILPYENPQFAEYWKRYKEYLQEEHHNFMQSRRENELLKVLKVWGGESDKKAISILSFLIRSGYRSFFKPTDRQLSGDEPATATEEQQQFSMNINKHSQI